MTENEKKQDLKELQFNTVKEVAEILTISEMGVRRLIDHGDLKSYRMGGTYRISSQQIKDFLEASST